MPGNEPRRRPGGQLDPEADRLILESTHRLLREVGYDRLTMDGVAREAGVARTTVYRRFRDKAELVSAAIEAMGDRSRQPGTGDTRRDLIAHLEHIRRNWGMSLAGTLLMEEPHNPRLIELFRQRMVHPQRQRVRETIEAGISSGQIARGTDVERLLDLLAGAIFGAYFDRGRPGPDWPERTVDAIWPALQPSGRSRSGA